ncbi:MAG: hypothetical protein HYR95_00695, partial [Candidatus Colwellbacteria bacterium]|nr:hypothetical protein [Candidatus Colwellbacteria bacterium]
MGNRITFLGLFFSVLYALLIFKVYNLQIQKGDEYKAQAFSIHRLSELMNPARGSIYFTDKNGEMFPAAINRNYPTIYAIPDEIDDPARTAEILSKIIQTDKGELNKILGKIPDPYEPILKKASDEQVNSILDGKIKGIYVKQEPRRFYPLQDIGAHIIGFVSSDNDNPGGVYGTELYYDKVLSGTSGKLNGDQIVKNSVGGKDIHLTIDRDIQAESERILTKLVADYKAEKGTVIVEEPKTGKILAMASVPGFNPNDYSKSGIETFLNPAVQAVYEPGSIFKVITMAAAINAGAITPETTFVDTGALVLDGKTIKNWDLKAHGKVTMTEVLEQSINTGAAFAGKTLGNSQFYNYLVKFGFKSKTDIDLPGEVIGSLKPLEANVRPIN